MATTDQKYQTLLNKMIEASDHEGVLDGYDEYVSTLPGIDIAKPDLIISGSVDSRFQDPEVHGIKTFDNGRRIGFVSVYVKAELTEKSGKKAQFELAKRILKDNQRHFTYGIFLFYDDNSNFRFSLIFDTIQDGKSQYNSFKRYTYFVDREQTNLTFKKRIAPLTYESLAEVIEAFSVEKVNEEFYKKISDWFHQFVGAKTDKNQYQTAFRLPSVDPQTGHKTYQDFAVRLIGRLVFVWFLKFKKDSEGKGLIPDELVSSNAVSSTENYYHDILEKVFFELLNKSERKRDDAKLGRCKEYSKYIPYLNGGLFEPLDSDFYKTEFSNILTIENQLFTEILTILESYNFTIDENSTSDVEVSVDPEMLGRIFENLLGEINPETEETLRNSTGSFYTPRAIVEYMVARSLQEYLKTSTQLTDDQVESLFVEEIELNLKESEKNQVIQALDSLKILDPACGSGAYPMGILHQIFKILEKVDPDNSLWLESMLQKLPNETLRSELRSNPARDYIRKLGIIETSIFGVDIQESAVEISRLRFFLSLIVDQEIQEEKENRGIEALPNLDFKFVSANTLLSLRQTGRQGAMADPEIKELIKRLKSIRERFFNEHDDKENLKRQFVETQNDLILKFDKLFSDNFSQKLAIWKPFKHVSTDWFDPEWMFGVTEGFDILIGNPPYIQLQKKKLIPPVLNKAYKDEGYLTFKSTGDIYALFYEKGFNLLKEGGVLCYITSNKWMRAGYGEVLRDYFARYTDPIELLDFGGFKVFKSATVDTNIYLGRKAEPNNITLKAVHFKNDFKAHHSLTDYVTKNSVTLTNLTKETWFIGSEAELKLKEKIERLGKPLKDWDVNIYRGVLTGLNEAFIIDEATRAKLIEEDPKSEEIIKPILRGRDIKRYGYEENGLYILFIPWHFPLHEDSSISGASLKAEVEFEKQYPAIYYHLLKYKEKLSERNKAETGKRYEWYALQRCAASYKEEFEKEKVVWGNISYSSRFSYSPDTLVINAPANLMTSDIESVKYLVACMNSSIFNWDFATTGIDLGKAFEWKKQYVEKIHLPLYQGKEKIKDQIENLVEKVFIQVQNNKDTTDLESQIDELVMDLYELTEEERGIVRGEK